MCLTRLSIIDERNALAKLPDTFICWKVIQQNGHCRYDNDKKEPKFTRSTHLAIKGLSTHRAQLNYPPSFHAYLIKPTANIRRENCLNCGKSQYLLRIVKCWADKKDIIRIGKCVADNYSGLAVAVSKITRK